MTLGWYLLISYYQEIHSGYQRKCRLPRIRTPLSLEYVNLKWRGRYKIWCISWRSISTGIRMLQMKVYIYCKTLLNSIQIQKSQRPRTSYLIARADHRKTIKVTKALCIKCAPVTGTVTGIVIAHNNRCFLVKHRDHHWSLWIRNISNKIDIK